VTRDSETERRRGGEEERKASERENEKRERRGREKRRRIAERGHDEIHAAGSLMWVPSLPSCGCLPYPHVVKPRRARNPDGL
jgi:hypothetical protein